MRERELVQATKECGGYEKEEKVRVRCVAVNDVF